MKRRRGRSAKKEQSMECDTPGDLGFGKEDRGSTQAARGRHTTGSGEEEALEKAVKRAKRE